MAYGQDMLDKIKSNKDSNSFAVKTKVIVEQ